MRKARRFLMNSLRLWAFAPLENYYMKPINVFDLVVRDWMKRRPDGKPFFFVQIGAHDGKNLDPIYPFITAHGWTGLFIEPQPDIFERLKKTYSGWEKQWAKEGAAAPNPYWFLNAAIGMRDGEMSLYRFKPGQNLPDHASMLTTYNQRALQTNGHGYMGEIEELRVPALSATTLCQKYPMQKLDLLQLDTEGMDAWIIREILAQGVKPQIIHFESFWKCQNYYALLPELEALGYGMTEVGVNMVCYRQPANERFDLEQANKGY